MRLLQILWHLDIRIWCRELICMSALTLCKCRRYLILNEFCKLATRILTTPRTAGPWLKSFIANIIRGNNYQFENNEVIKYRHRHKLKALTSQEMSQLSHVVFFSMRICENTRRPWTLSGDRLRTRRAEYSRVHTCIHVYWSGSQTSWIVLHNIHRVPKK